MGALQGFLRAPVSCKSSGVEEEREALGLP